MGGILPYNYLSSTGFENIRLKKFCILHRQLFSNQHTVRSINVRGLEGSILVTGFLDSW
jgi:hypothetical protein